MEDPDFDLSTSAQTHLINKRRGGGSNAQGNRYEEFFALAEIVRWASERWDDQKAITFSDQAAAFVDDLLVAEPISRHFYQLKSGQNVGWGNCTIGTICGDFRCQCCCESRAGNAFQLYLVVANEDSLQTLSTSIPSSIQPETKVRFFPLYPSTIDMLSSDLEFRHHLSQISRGKRNIADLDALAKNLLGNWVGSLRKNIALSELLAYRQVPPLGRIELETDLGISQSLIVVFDGIEGFEFRTRQGVLEWETQFGDAGVFAYPLDSEEFSTWEEILMQNPPQDFESLEPLLAWIAP